jgi:WD40-like Beta Propeller Repeat
MWSRLVLCAVLGGCSFRASSAGDDGQGHDAALRDAAADATAGGPKDGPIDGQGGGATDCFGHWLAGNPVISTPQELTTLSTTSSERDPWISLDGLTLYFASNRAGTSDIYLASRASKTQPFGNTTLLVNLRTGNHDEDRPALTEDQKMFVMASDKAGLGVADIYFAIRPNTTQDFGTPDLAHMANVNAVAGSKFDPFLTKDGLKLYLSPDPPGAPPQQIALATRLDANSDFTTPVNVAAINNVAGAVNYDPSVSSDERIILFSSVRAGGVGQGDLWYATRQDATQPFGTPVLVPTVNTAQSDGDPMLSADGCELYFSSSRNGGDQDLFVAQITK